MHMSAESSPLHDNYTGNSGYHVLRAMAATIIGLYQDLQYYALYMYKRGLQKGSRMVCSRSADQWSKSREGTWPCIAKILESHSARLHFLLDSWPVKQCCTEWQLIVEVGAM
jgi:hypothetical protein